MKRFAVAGQLGVQAIASTPMQKQACIVKRNNLPSRIERRETTISSLCLPGEDNFKRNGKCGEHTGKTGKEETTKNSCTTRFTPTIGIRT